MYGNRLEPDLVVVYFGWNDHWLAYGATDAEKEFAPSGLSKAYITLHRFRLAQLFFKISDSLTSRTASPINEVRVPLDQYRENLMGIQDRFRADSIPIIFITAPTSHYRLGVPDYLVDMKYVKDKDSAEGMHRNYNEMVRLVSHQEGSYLLDLEKEFNSLSTAEMASLFWEDGIHFTPHGLSAVAEELTSFIERQILTINE